MNHQGPVKRDYWHLSRSDECDKEDKLHEEELIAGQEAYLAQKVLKTIETKKYIGEKSLSSQIIKTITEDVKACSTAKQNILQLFTTGVELNKQQDMERMVEAMSTEGSTQKFTFIPNYTVTSVIWSQLLKNRSKRLICGFPGISKSTSVLLIKRLTDKIVCSAMRTQKIYNPKKSTVKKVLYYSINLGDSQSAIRNNIFNQILKDHPSFKNYRDEFVNKFSVQDQKTTITIKQMYQQIHKDIPIEITLVVDQINILAQKHQIFRQYTQLEKQRSEDQLVEIFNISAVQIVSNYKRSLLHAFHIRKINRHVNVVTYLSSVNIELQLTSLLGLDLQITLQDPLKPIYINFLDEKAIKDAKITACQFILFEVRRQLVKRIPDQSQEIPQQIVNCKQLRKKTKKSPSDELPNSIKEHQINPSHELAFGRSQYSFSDINPVEQKPIPQQQRGQFNDVLHRQKSFGSSKSLQLHIKQTLENYKETIQSFLAKQNFIVTPLMVRIKVEKYFKMIPPDIKHLEQFCNYINQDLIQFEKRFLIKLPPSALGQYLEDLLLDIFTQKETEWKYTLTYQEKEDRHCFITYKLAAKVFMLGGMHDIKPDIKKYNIFEQISPFLEEMEQNTDKTFLFVPFNKIDEKKLKNCVQNGVQTIRGRLCNNKAIDFILMKCEKTQKKLLLSIHAYDFTINTQGIIPKLKKFLKYYERSFVRKNNEKDSIELNMEYYVLIPKATCDKHSIPINLDKNILKIGKPTFSISHSKFQYTYDVQPLKKDNREILKRIGFRTIEGKQISNQNKVHETKYQLIDYVSSQKADFYSDDEESD